MVQFRNPELGGFNLIARFHPSAAGAKLKQVKKFFAHLVDNRSVRPPKFGYPVGTSDDRRFWCQSATASGKEFHCGELVHAPKWALWSVLDLYEFRSHLGANGWEASDGL